MIDAMVLNAMMDQTLFQGLATPIAIATPASRPFRIRSAPL